MKQQKIVIASTLKPLDDTRMFEKLGVSLSCDSTYNICVIGQATNSIPAYKGIQFIGLKPVQRLSIGRWLLPFKILFITIKVKPSLLIVNTHELLIVSIANRILFGCKIVYDIRENYYRNILYAEAFPWVVRRPLALWVRLKERVTAPLFHHFILAEKAYENELSFIGDRYTVLANKTVLPKGIIRHPNQLQINLLFSGTIASSTGIFEAIALAQKLHRVDGRVRLRIVGYCAIPAIREKVTDILKDKPWVSLIGFNNLVPHAEILIEIRQAHFGIIYYPPSPHTAGSIPTKLYEYMAYQLPMLTWQNQGFAPWVIQNQAGLVVDVHGDNLLEEMINKNFYPHPIEGLEWETEKFRRLIAQLLG
ncbi:MAG: glycosyltransferase [Cyclobacteriaceae bacterium]|nr:glycosyltransferase [Cyclobacteriaceae bacterium]